MADLHRKSLDMSTFLSVQFFLFHAVSGKFGQIIGLPFGLAPRLGNPRSAAGILNHGSSEGTETLTVLVSGKKENTPRQGLDLSLVSLFFSRLITARNEVVVS